MHEPLKGVTEYIHFHTCSFTAFIDNFKSIRFDHGHSVSRIAFYLKMLATDMLFSFHLLLIDNLQDRE